MSAGSSRQTSFQTFGEAAEILEQPSAVDIIVTVIGGVQASEAVLAAGGLLGHESTQTRPPRRFPVEFVDWPFQDEGATFTDHYAVVREERPKYAVAPDVEGHRTLDHVIRQADRLAEFAEEVIIVPKDADPRDVPDRFRVGLPFRQNFAMPLRFPITDFGLGGPVHVLGGNPSRQLELPDLGVTVASIDTPHPILFAQVGDVWTASGRVTMPDLSFRLRVFASILAMRAAWNETEMFSLGNFETDLYVAAERQVRGRPLPSDEFPVTDDPIFNILLDELGLEIPMQ